MTTNSFLSKVAATGKTILRTAISVSTGVSDAFKVVCTGANGKVDISILPSGLGVDTEVMATSENFSAGKFVNIYDDGGTRTARLADVTNARPAHGYVIAASTSPTNATIYKAGTNGERSGLTPGAELFLTTAGDVAEEGAIEAPAQIIQSIGYASDAGEAVFVFQSPIEIES